MLDVVSVVDGRVRILKRGCTRPDAEHGAIMAMIGRIQNREVQIVPAGRYVDGDTFVQEPITCPLCSHQTYIGNHDLDGNVHKGFTIGRGKAMYFMMTWHGSGHATVYRESPEGGLIKRYVDGDSMITIHFKDGKED